MTTAEPLLFPTVDQLRRENGFFDKARAMLEEIKCDIIRENKKSGTDHSIAVIIELNKYYTNYIRDMLIAKGFDVTEPYVEDRLYYFYISW